MNYVSLAQVVIFTTYLFIVVGYFGVLDSISKSYYEFGKRGYSTAFVIFLWSICLGLILQQWVYTYKEITSMLFVITAFFLAVVPITGNYMDKRAGPIHYISSVMSIALGFLIIIVEDWPSWKGFIPLVAYGSTVMLTRKWNNFTWWTEVFAFACIFSRLLFKP
jgi:hypothetical protein